MDLVAQDYHKLIARKREMASLLENKSDNPYFIQALGTMRYYAFSNILNGRINGREDIDAALQSVDILLPPGKLRIATLQIDMPDTEQLPIFDQLYHMVIELSSGFNRALFSYSPPPILAHLCNAHSDMVCLMPILSERADEAFFSVFLQQVNAALQGNMGWGFTACVSDAFDDLTNLAQMYFDTRQLHELLVDANTDGSVWLASEYREQWESAGDAAESAPWVEPMRVYVMENYNNPEMNINYLARQFNISHAYAGRKFKEVTGLSLLELIHRCRLDKLEQLLNEGRPLKIAAQDVGYGSLITMQRARERYRSI